MTRALAHLGRTVRAWFDQAPLPEPEPVNAHSRPMVGFFAGLTDEQKRDALAYRGPENHGDADLRRPAA